MEAFALSDVGVCRDVNQDAVFAQCTPIGNLSNLFVVADGMGGHQAGDYASAYAIARLQDLIKSESGRDSSNLLEWAFQVVNNEEYDKGYSREELYGMGTTLVACTIDEDQILTVANVGDSRLYIFNPVTGLRQITRDHSFVEELARKGQIQRDSELYEMKKNVITRAIGAEEEVKTDIFQLELDMDDQILMCSDGLTNMVPDNIISLFMAVPDTAENKARGLIEAANHAGGLDNVSVIVIQTGNSASSSTKTAEDLKIYTEPEVKTSESDTGGL